MRSAPDEGTPPNAARGWSFKIGDVHELLGLSFPRDFGTSRQHAAPRHLRRRHVTPPPPPPRAARATASATHAARAPAGDTARAAASHAACAAAGHAACATSARRRPNRRRRQVRRRAFRSTVCARKTRRVCRDAEDRAHRLSALAPMRMCRRRSCALKVRVLASPPARFSISFEPFYFSEAHRRPLRRVASDDLEQQPRAARRQPSRALGEAR